MCTFSGTYDSRKYTEKQLRDTLKLLNGANSYLSKGPWVWKWEDIESIDIPALDAEYRAKRAEIESLEVVPLPYWQNVKAAQLKELDQVYRHQRTKALAYTDPKVLRDYPAAPACKAKYVEPLIARDDSLLKVWLDVNMNSRSNNADPGRLKRIFDEQMASPDRIKFAVVEVMGFGWGNCANAEIERDEGASNGSHGKEFRKLFTRVRTIDCEEP